MPDTMMTSTAHLTARLHAESVEALDEARRSLGRLSSALRITEESFSSLGERTRTASIAVDTALDALHTSEVEDPTNAKA
jgi:hypothetical protein